MSIPLPSLPPGWAWSAVAEVGATTEQPVLTGPFGTSMGQEDFVSASGENVPVLTIGCLRESGIDLAKAMYVKPEKAESMTRYRLKPGDIMFSRMATVGRAGFVEQRHAGALFNYHLMRLRLRDDVLAPHFFIYFVRGSDVVRSYVRDVNHGMTRDGINTEQLLALPVPLAPRQAQQRIVEALDSYLSRLDAAVASLERVQAKLRLYRASVLKAAVEGRLVPTEAELARQEQRDYEPASVLLERILKERRRGWEEAELARLQKAGKAPRDDKWKAKYKEPVAPDTSGLPELPDGWCWASTDQLFTFVTSGSRGWARYYSESGPLFLRMGNLDHDSISLDLADVQRVSPPESTEGTRTQVEPGDLLISITADVGMVGRVPVGLGVAYINQHVALARPAGPAATAYFAWFLAAEAGGQTQFRALQRGATKKGLGLDDIRAVAVPLPPAAEQERISEEIDRRFSIERDVNRTQLAALKRVIRLRQSVLKWAFEGKLVDQDPADEPAEKLLERIRAERLAAAPAKQARRRRAAAPRRCR